MPPVTEAFPGDSSLTVATIQALGFATSTALCIYLAVLQWRSERLTDGMTVGMWLGGAVWTGGNFARYVFLLLGLPTTSPQVVLAQLLAWSPTCFGPALIARLVDREIPGPPLIRRLWLAAASASGVVLFILFIAAVFKPGLGPSFGSVAILSFGNAMANAAACGIVYGIHRRRQRNAGQSIAVHWLLRSALVLICLEAIAIPFSILAPAGLDTVRTITVVASQQWALPWAVLVAAFLAESRYADIVLKRSLTLVMSVVVATFILWWVPGLPRGLPLVLASLTVAALVIGAPSFHRVLNWAVDRVLLRRPDYGVLFRAFADESRRTADENELFVLVTRTIRDALRLEPRVVSASRLATPTQTGLERIDVKGPAGTDYVLEMTPTVQGRTLMHDEVAFLQNIAAETGRRLESLEFERERAELHTREERLKRSLTEAELKALRAQVDPHFLFNTLNTITDLVSTDPEKAESMTERLADFFRYTLLHPDRTLSTLDQELDFVRHYLEIEQVRFGERLRAEVSADPALAGVIVPSLILQPLVENAVRHGLAPKLEGGTLTVSANRQEGFLHLQIADDGVGMKNGSARGSGIGLQNVRERLRALYGSAATMDIETGVFGTRVVLHLPLAHAD